AEANLDDSRAAARDAPRPAAHQAAARHRGGLSRGSNPWPLRMPEPHRPIGLLAGSGRFPISFAHKARGLGIPVVCVGIRHEAATERAGLVRTFDWAGIGRLGRMIRCFKAEGVERVVMAGKVTKVVLHKPWRTLTFLPDWRGLQFLYSRRRKDNKDDSMLL